jgi:hypothetical protein
MQRLDRLCHHVLDLRAEQHQMSFETRPQQLIQHVLIDEINPESINTIMALDEWYLYTLLEHILCIFTTHLMLNLATTMPIIHDYWFSFIFI